MAYSLILEYSFTHFIWLWFFLSLMRNEFEAFSRRFIMPFFVQTRHTSYGFFCLSHVLILLLWLACWSSGFGCERSQVWLPDRPLLPMIAYKLLFLHWVKGVGKTIWKDYSKNVYLSNPFFKFVLNHIQLIQLLIATVKTYRTVLSCFLVRTYTNF